MIIYTKKKGKKFSKREVWVWVPGFEGRYRIFISDDKSKVGKVRSVQRNRRGKGGYIAPIKGRILKPNMDDGYYYVSLSIPGPKLGQWKMYTRRIHRIIVEICHGPCPEGMECRHLNDDKTDNTPDNVCWGTHKQNTKDAVKNGKILKGENHGRSTITEVDVKEIRKRYKICKNQSQVAREMKLNGQLVRKVIKRITWKHVA
jgi:hypothetical protein